ncbi:MAG: cytochrome c family protein [Ignavibacteriae bacterium]|nr:cytochrome c family protein [Ignavibacteriota bacterium]
MKNLLYIPSIILLITALVLFKADENISQPKYKYVGVNTCIGACHQSEELGNQYEVWNNSQHSKAFLTLQSEAADSIARSLGYETPAEDTRFCIRCHTLGIDVDESELQSSFDMTQGVQCESCHGPGSEYKKLSVMKDSAEAVNKGLIIHTEKENWCITCHNPESPTYIPFDYEPLWEMIAHNKIKPE